MASTHTGTHRLTVEDYYALSDDENVELVDGKLVPRVSPLMRHAQVAARLIMKLGAVLGDDSEAILGSAWDFPTVPGSARRGDIVYLRAEDRAHGLDARGRLLVPPTLVIEIVSPGDEERDYVEKLQEYAQAGIPHYWIVDPGAGTIDLHELAEGVYNRVAHLAGADRLASALFPGLDVPLPALFRWP